MTNFKHGETSWDEPVPGGNRENISFKDLFLKLEKGSNVVRIITSPYVYLMHRWKPEGDPGYGYRFSCSASHGSCPICEKGDKPKRRWVFGVIERKQNAYKVIDVGASVFKSIQSLVKDSDWGNPNLYDIDIKVDQSAGPSGYYTVNPKPHKPLSASDLKHQESSVDVDQLQKLVSPPLPEKLMEKLAKIMADRGPVPGQVSMEDSSNKEFPEFKPGQKAPF